ncbi:MAG: exopolyphosphatase, partial [Gammaproteobacteria bacterium]|nr:exopolyphosphatase [Gammaproteobacteria bacterium]
MIEAADNLNTETELNTNVYAAIDLGSNSFHMMVARMSDDQLVVIDKMKDMVQLAAGLTEDRILTDEAIDRGISCLEKFGQRIHELPRQNIRAVGTNTLRQARNGGLFLSRAREALGHNIEIIAGREEARLIYIGVAHSMFNDSDNRLVVDIGGGSTELIIGKGFDPILTESLYMGCVNMTQRYFPEGQITAKKMRKAVVHARQELESSESIYKREGWQQAIGSSGTAIAIHDVVTGQGWSESGITRESLEQLMQELASTGKISELKFNGLSERRAPIFVGGVMIMYAIFEALEIDRMDISEGALREGLIYDLIGRTHEQDIRDRTVESLVNQYQVDTEYVNRVIATADELFRQLKQDWKLGKQDRKIIHWATSLFPIGMRVAHSQYQKHGEYLVKHSDMPGFSR